MWCVAVVARAAAPPACADAGANGAELPDWRDQVVYFAMIDRFDDGDPRNNDQGTGEYDPADNARWSGGDLHGLRRRLDYIHGLGATALWITPPVAQQWWNPRARYGGYPGYWAEHFSAVDAHYGDLADYRALADALHACGMALVQDVVVNHTGDYFGYADGAWSADDPARGFVRHPDGRGRLTPRQAPFDRNDAHDGGDRAASIYHWTPDIADFGDRRQETDFQLSGLDDLDTENPQVRRALRRVYGDWIARVGVDAFRIDTAFYVPEEYFRDFLYADDAQAPGIMEAARRAGRPRFHVFGEGFAIDRAYDDAGARKVERYATDAQGRPLLPGMINFPLYGTLGDVFARGRPTAELAWRIGNMMQVHARPQLMPTFVDNHDVDRFLAGGSEAGLKQALLAIMTLPGIPTVYYGTEQGFTGQREAMFAGGHGSGGRDRFDTGAPLYRYLQRAIALRRGDLLFSRGAPVVLAETPAAPGALAWRMDHEGRSALVAFNSADGPTLLAGLETGLPAGTVLEPLFAIDGQAPRLVVDARGRVDAVLPPRAGWVWKAGGREAVVAGGVESTIDPLPATVEGDLRVAGRAPGPGQVRLVLDGDLEAATTIVAGSDGRWQATLDTAGLVDPQAEHVLVAWSPEQALASPSQRFRVQRHWRELARVEDPAGDDHGPGGRYVYPVDASWRGRHTLDLLGATVSASGGSLKIDLRLRDLVADWNPPNGFDHLAVTAYLQLPGRAGGATVMPLQDASLPGGMRWHYRLRAGGWSNALFSSEGASAQGEGTPSQLAARVDVDRERGTLSFVLPAAAIGRPASLSGVVLHVTTWDYDGGYRALAPQPGGHIFGGGDVRGPKVMDELRIVLP
ncbi:alpha-amylase family glycosyl hydrolase [Pseudoxanthomonas koreensis]|uniref:alpha-amylase family glycosyl hydrolase n=1 Tax=Pseudoxanthomonas koreensis TaxID=266061 RepID=UPI001EE42942|nr:alpha-amylase family glycosyl hydrolase [Pseudoxanthomonas koreensis]